MHLHHHKMSYGQYEELFSLNNNKLVRSWERRPERIHSESPVPQTTTSYF